MSKKKKKKVAPKEPEMLLSAEKMAAKKAAVLGTKKKRLPLLFIAIFICIALAAGGAVFYFTTTAKSIASATAEPPVLPESSSDTNADVIMYPAMHFASGIAQHFHYQDGDVTIKYFILKSSDGVIRAAFDACDVCWPAGKGYYQDGEYMVCRNCGRRFASTLVNEVRGGCNPAPLNRTVKDGQVFIQVKDILEGRQYFDFSQHT